jgi:hypothetical protein
MSLYVVLGADAPIRRFADSPIRGFGIRGFADSPIRRFEDSGFEDSGFEDSR